MSRLLADAHLSRRFVEACVRLQSDFPIIHIADWMKGKHRMSKDPVLLSILREHGLAPPLALIGKALSRIVAL